MLQEGDVIELKKGMRVYADVPRHFVYSNRRGDYSITHSDITLKDNFDYLCGKYIVIKALMTGGGHGHSDGWRVFCAKESDPNIKVDFFQTGAFTAMIKDIKPIGRATMKWSMD